MWNIIIILTILIVIGFIYNCYELKSIIKRYKFLIEYFSCYQKFTSEIVKSKKINSKDYEWLMKNVDKAQIYLGEAGLITYIGRGILNRNNQILLNNMVNVISNFNSPYGFVSSDIEEINVCNSAFLRKIGIYEEIIDNYKYKLFNPFYNLNSAFKFLFRIPISILTAIGLLNEEKEEKIISSVIVKILSGLFSLITIISSIITVIIGWEETISIIKKL